MKKVLYLLFCLIFFSNNNLTAGDELRAGVISIKQLSELTVEATIRLVVQAQANITDLDICWGDGECINFPALTGTVNTAQGIKYYTFQTEHTYQELNTYFVSVDHCCYDDDISNITSGQLANFKIETMILLQEDFNSTPVFSDPNQLIGIGTIGSIILIDGVSADVEGDMNTSEVCTIENVVDYAPLDQLPSSPLNVSSGQGVAVWSTPGFNGNYILQLCTKETRNGIVISETKRIVCFMVDPSFMTATKELSNVDIQLFPNPSLDGQLYLNNNGITNTNQSKVLIINSLQQVVMSDAWNGSEQKSLSIDHLSKGIYYVIVMLENGDQYYEAVIIQ